MAHAPLAVLRFPARRGTDVTMLELENPAPVKVAITVSIEWEPGASEALVTRIIMDDI